MRDPERRKGTSTSEFGVSRRENHDSSNFYARFTPPKFSVREDVGRRKAIDGIFGHDASAMPEIDDDSVALVVTSPPYFAGKAYETVLGEGHVPADYLAYLDMLRCVFAECQRKLEPGGRIAVNVANLGRKPYRSLSSDVIKMLEDLGFLLRGEVIWVKAKGAGGSCAWGSFQRPGNPVLRDLTERIVIASKERFDRALSPKRRAPDLPHEWSLFKDEFMEATTDVWEIAPESATRAGHPAPFPVELPERLIHLYTYVGDLVLDPFMGSGTTAVAAVRTDRRYAGYDTEPAYVERANARIAEERRMLAERAVANPRELVARLSPFAAAHDDEDFQARAVREGAAARDLAFEALEHCGFSDIKRGVSFREGIDFTFRARDAAGFTWYFDVSGGFTSTRPGLRRADTLWKALGKAAVLQAIRPEARLVLLTTHAPPAGSAGHRALGVVRGHDEHKLIRDVVELTDPADVLRLTGYARGEDGGRSG